MSDETEPKKERQIYKGDELTILELEKEAKDARWIPIQSLERIIPAFSGRYSANVLEQRLPGLLLVDKVQPSYMGAEARRLITLDPRTGFKVRNWELPTTLKVNRLTGRIGAEMLANFMEHQKENWQEHFLQEGIMSGTDPEIFVEAEGNLLPAFNFLGSKSNPNYAPVDATPASGQKVYWDGFQAEFEVTPATCLSYVVDSIHFGLRGVIEAAKAVNSNARLSLKNVVPIPAEILASAKDKHVEFGCAPSHNVYGLQNNSAPGREVPYRFAGGHIHMGIHKPKADYVAAVKAMDAILAVACVSAFASFDNPIRREYYGLPGEYRLPPHGLEYRVLSNAWLMHPVMTHLIFDLGRTAARVGFNGFLHLWQAEERETVDVVKGCDVEGARKIMERNKGLFLKLLSINPAYQDSADRAYGAFYNGAESIVKDPSDIEGNWLLKRGWLHHSDATNRKWTTAKDRIAQKVKV